MWISGDEKLDNELKFMVRSLPGLKLTVGPVLTSIGDQPYRSDGVVVWAQFGDSNEHTKLFSGESILADLAAHVRSIRKQQGL